MNSYHLSVRLFRFLAGLSSSVRKKSPRRFQPARLLVCERLEFRFLLAVGDLRVVNYNVLGFDGAPSTDFGTVLKAIGDEVYAGRSRPIDVLAIQEVASQATTTASIVSQLNAIYGAGRYSRGNLNGTSTSTNQTVGLVYNTQTITLVNEVGVGTPSSTGPARQPIRYQLRPIGVPLGNDFYLYNSHYKATSTSTATADEARRNVEAQQIRQNADALGQGVHIIYSGDFNTKSSNEASIQTLLATGNGQAIDPINRLGNWSGSSSFRDIFSQAPLLNPPASSGLVGGGLNDRFDLQFLTSEWKDGVGLEYTTGSYRTFANNGSVAVNGNINSTSNTAPLTGVANRSVILDLLTTVTDHLPVVVDYEFLVTTPILSVALTNSSISENGGTTKATITRNSSTTSSILISLSSSDITAATLPTSVTIPAGATSATVTINAVNDSIADGNQLTTLTAQSSGFVSGNALLTITDDEIASLSLSLSLASIPELNGVSTGTVRRNTPTTSSMLISISSSDVTAATVPATVTIPAGSDSATFLITAVNDAIADGNQPTTVQVSANGLVSASAVVTVVDDDVAALALSLASNSISENSGTTIATVRRNTPRTNSLLVNLTSSDTTAATLPVSVTIPAGSDTATFVVSAVNDSVADGDQISTLTASTAGLASGTTQVTVRDDETAQLTFSFDKASISENGGTSKGTVRRNTPTASLLNVALIGDNVGSVFFPMSINILAGADSATFDLTAIDDALANGNRFVSVTASTVGLASGVASITVTDDETAQLVLTLDNRSISENGGSATATVRRNTQTTTALNVSLISSYTTAATVPASVVIPAGASIATFLVTAVNDPIADGDQTATLSASASGQQSGTIAITVVDDEVAELSLAFDKISLMENGGRVSGTVSRNTPTTNALLVNLTQDESASVLIPATVIIPAGSASVVFDVTAVDNAIASGDRDVVITASASGLVSAAKHITVIEDDQARLSLSLNSTTLAENGGSATATVSRNTPVDSALIVSIVSSDPTAATAPLFVTIPAGATSASFTVSAMDDLIADGDQSVDITVSSGSLASASTQILVIDDETASLSLSLALTSITEKGGITRGTVSRNTPITSSLSVSLGHGSFDFVSLPSTVTIPAGASFVEFDVTAIDDSIAIGDQIATLTASSTGHAPASTQITITDDETPQLEITFSSNSINEVGGQTTGTIRRNTPVNTAVTVTFSSNLTAALNIPASVTILIGASFASFSVSALDNSIATGDQDSIITANASGIASSSAALKIIDDDIPTLSVSIDKKSISENGGIATGTLSRNSPPKRDLQVSLSSSNGAAIVPDSISIPAGLTFVTFPITAINDLIARGDQLVSIAGAAAGFSTNASQITVIEDDVPSLALTLSNMVISEASGTTQATVTRNTPTNTALTVTLTSSDVGEATVPSSVTILAGESRATFTVTAIADGLVDGTQRALITATANGLISASAEVTVLDVDVWTWTNPRNALDTDDDNSVSPLDVLVLIDELNRNGTRKLSPPTSKPIVFYDVDRDLSLSPLDVLVVINFLNNKGSKGFGGGGEGESFVLSRVSASEMQVDVVDSFFADWGNQTAQKAKKRRS